MKKTIYIVVGILVIVLLLSWSRIFPTKSLPVLVTDPSMLPGISTSTVPSGPEIAHLRERLTDIGLAPTFGMEGAAMHIHQHLDLSINGAPVTVPAGIGINTSPLFYSPIHTHDTSGIIHVESAVVRDFHLGQVFDIWGVRFTNDCLGEYCTDATNTLRVYSNGELVSGNLRDMILTSHQEVMVVYGPASSTPAMISSYTFPAGY